MDQVFTYYNSWAHQALVTKLGISSPWTMRWGLGKDHTWTAGNTCGYHLQCCSFYLQPKDVYKITWAYYVLIISLLCKGRVHWQNILFVFLVFQRGKKTYESHFHLITLGNGCNCQLKTDNWGSLRSYDLRKEVRWAQTICQESNSLLGV